MKNNAPPMTIGHIKGAINDTANALETLYELIKGTARSNNIGIIQHRDSGKNFLKFFLLFSFI